VYSVEPSPPAPSTDGQRTTKAQVRLLEALTDRTHIVQRNARLCIHGAKRGSQGLESCKKHYNLLCITFQRGIGQRDDWLEPMLRAHYPDANIVHVDTLEAARSMAARVDVLVTMRFHLGILGIMWGKPIVIIDHEQKMAALAKDFSLPSISLQEFISGAQLDMQGLLATYDANRTSARLAIERDRVATNFEWMLKSRGS